MAQERGNELEATAHGHLEVEPGQVWKITGLGDHERRDNTDGGRHNVLGPSRAKLLEHHGSWDRRVQDGCFQALDVWHQLAAHYRLEQLFLTGVIEVNCALCHACLGGHLFQASRSEAALLEAGECRSQNLGWA